MSAWNNNTLASRFRSHDGPVVAFFDVDGTLVYRDPVDGPGDYPSERVCKSVRAFTEQGGIPVLSTGRSRMGVTHLLDGLPFRGHVSMDGAHAAFDDTVIVDRCFPRDLLQRIIVEALRIDMPVLFEGTELCIELNTCGESLFNCGPVVKNAHELYATGLGLRFGKIDFIDDALEAYHNSEFLQRELTYYDVGDGYHELVMPGVSKGSGATALLNYLKVRMGVMPSRGLAFGDSENDLSLFEVADIGIAMGQAASHVRNAADYVTDSCANDGVATALEHLGLI